jgi:hypothetical protein
MIFSKFSNFFLKSKAFTNDYVKYEFDNQKFGVIRIGFETWHTGFLFQILTKIKKKIKLFKRNKNKFHEHKIQKKIGPLGHSVTELNELLAKSYTQSFCLKITFKEKTGVTQT